MKRTVFLTLMACLFCASTFVSAETVNVVYDTNPGIRYAEYTVTFSDSTVLGFNLYSGYWYFDGAITLRDSLYIPDSIVCNSQTVPVQTIDADFSAAPNLVKLSVPATVTYIKPFSSQILRHASISA